MCVLTRASGRVSPVSCDVMMLPFLNNKNIASPKSSSPQTILKIVFPSPYKTVGRGPAVGKCDTALQYHISMAFLLPALALAMSAGYLIPHTPLRRATARECTSLP